MTQPSAILIAPTVPLRALPDAERDVLRRFFTEHVKGMDSASDKRWRRFIGQLFRAEPGEGFELVRLEHRNLPFHARHRAILERLFQSQERYQLIDAMHDWLKLKTYFVTWGEGRRGNPIPIPRSTAFDQCSEDEMREFHGRVVDFLHDPACQRHLWPHLKAPARGAMVDNILAKPGEGDQQ